MGYYLTPRDYVNYLERVSDKIKKEKDYITALDAATGDGDHWANMKMGFEKVLQKREELQEMNFPTLFRTCGLEMMSGIGGSSGVLYGSAYLAAAKVVRDTSVLDIDTLYSVLKAELDAIMARGNAKPGYKTMIDPLYQALQRMEKALRDKKSEQEVLEELKKGAVEGMKATAQMEAVRGRACYQEDKGVGHLDPGAVTMCYQLELLAESVEEGKLDNA